MNLVQIVTTAAGFELLVGWHF